MKKTIELNCTTKSGTITQNGYYVSLKTDLYSDYLHVYIKLAQELKDWLKANGLKPAKKEMKMEKSLNSNSRKHCITVCTTVVEQNEVFKAIPYSPNSID